MLKNFIAKIRFKWFHPKPKFSYKDFPMNDDFMGYEGSENVVLHLGDFPKHLEFKKKSMLKHYPVIKDTMGNLYFLISDDGRFDFMYEILTSTWMEDSYGNKYVRGLFHDKKYLRPIDNIHYF